MSVINPDVSKYLTYAIRKIPAIPLGINFLIAEYAFDPCPSNASLIFWCYYPILCLITIAWESLSSYSHFSAVYPRKPKSEKITYTIISACVSFILFISMTYFLKNGRPMTCMINYNKDVAVVLFAMGVLISSFITYCEHFKWGKLIPYEDVIDI
jgi:hypothetical protein